MFLSSLLTADCVLSVFAECRNYDDDEGGNDSKICLTGMGMMLRTTPKVWERALPVSDACGGEGGHASGEESVENESNSSTESD